jgi:hypothetical protein
MHVPAVMQVPAVEQVAAVPVPMNVVVPESVRVPLSGLRMSQGVQMAIKALLQQGLKLSLPKYDHPSGKVNSGLAARPTRRISPRYLRAWREMKIGLSGNHNSCVP